MRGRVFLFLSLTTTAFENASRKSNGLACESDARRQRTLPALTSTLHNMSQSSLRKFNRHGRTQLSPRATDLHGMQSSIHPKGENTMLRTTAIALAALATVGIASLATPSSAEAHGWKGPHHRHWHGHHIHVRPVYHSCWRRVWVNTYHGGFWKRINVCY
jgi:hypothetical protein